uniref:Exonuclease domain-containing protein n=1 Tax=viral metagenome TaxID=1070528 RepID=A0A6C0LIG7_9ZZZZ
MEKVLVFDTETTGLIPKRGRGYDNYEDYKKLDSYPRLLSICWKVYLSDGTKISSNYFIVKPKDFIIDNDSVACKINGITKEISETGTDIFEIFKSFESSLEGVTKIIAHNISFDSRIVKSELYRYELHDLLSKFDDINKYCTCLNGKDLTQIKMKGWKDYKIPKLNELYKHLFNEDFDNAHNAEADVDACARCYFKMI